jgi:type IV pilus assembly protein PilX
MKPGGQYTLQQGMSLIISMLFLLVVTAISVIAASNSALGLKMSANMQDSYSSFQSAEAGIFAVLGLAGTDYDPFDADDSDVPFNGIPADEQPLRELNDGVSSVSVELFLTASATECPRKLSGSSVGLKDCEYYRIASEHNVASKARTRVELGVVKELVGGAL